MFYVSKRLSREPIVHFCCLVPQLCLTLCDHRDHDLPDSSVHSPGKNTGVGCHFILQGIFLIQGLNLCLLHWQADSLPLGHQGSPNSSLKRAKISPLTFF